MKLKGKRKEVEKTPEQLSSEGFSFKKNEKFEQLSLDTEQTSQDSAENPVENSKPLPSSQKEQVEEYIPQNEQEQLEEAEEKVKKLGTKKKKWLNILFLFINIGVVAGILAYQFSSEDVDISSIGTLFCNINWGIFFLLIVLYALLMFSESFRFWNLIFSTTKTHHPALSYKTAALGKYYDSLTPLSAGGEPFQIYYMSKRGLSGRNALSVCMGKYVTQQLAYVIFTFIIMILSISLSQINTIGGTVVTATSWVGFALNSFLIIVVALVSINKAIGNKLVSGILKFLHKIKIVKNYEKHYNKIQKVVSDYQSTMKKYAKEKGTFFIQLFFSFLFYFLHYSIPFLIHASFYGFHFELFGQIFIYCAMIDLTASFFPLPGGTGASELSFSVLFASIFEGGDLIWALLIWRFFTYYIYIFQGFFVTAYDYLHGNKKLEWTKKRWALEAESRAFEEKEHKEFELMLAKKNKKKK